MTMKMPRIVALAFALFLFPAAAAASPFGQIYVIGDSASDQGNLFEATLALTGSGIPAEDHYFEGRFSNGEIYVDLLAQRLGVPLAPTLLGGTNFAFGGSRTSYNIVEDPPTPGGFPPGTFPWTLERQREAFVERAIVDPEAFYIVYSGSNDVVDLIGRALVQGVDATQPLIDGVVQAIRSVIEAYVAAGAQDVLVPNLPDLGKVPRVVAADPLPGQPPGSTLVADAATALTLRFNAALDAMLDGFDDVNIVRFDVFSFFGDVLADPARYGFTNVTQPCYTGFVDPAGPNDTVCDTPQDYAFWDGEHPTAAFHAVLAEHLIGVIVADLLDDLVQRLDALELPHPVDRGLYAKLAVAQRIRADGVAGNDGAIAGALQSFMQLVAAQQGKAIPDETARQLIDRAQRVVRFAEAPRGE